jgi:xanthine dehydrogenase/oxidase
MCKTNIATNTAFRGFGGPQSMFICEAWIDHISRVANISPETVRRLNMYQPHQKTHYGQELKEYDATTTKCWDKLLKISDYEDRVKKIKAWNEKNKFRKRGIACIPTKFGMSFTASMLNQAGALVHIYRDGSVLVSHAGTEMGQGLHTKMIQIASNILQVPMDNIYIQETSTDKIPNTSPTAASVQSDLNGGAVADACRILYSRLKPIIAENPGAPFKDIALKAWLRQVDLSAHGFYSRPNLGFDFVKQEGKPFLYFVTGAACSEVELDCLTGDHQIIQTDIVMDVGKSLSPAIDIGQIEGGFAQGYGWLTLEEVVYLPNGNLHTRGPGTYKIPGFQDVPLDMRVHLLGQATNPTTIYSSKGIGEPPLFLGSSVFFALKEAIYEARFDQTGKYEYFPLQAPATCERLRMSCTDHLTKIITTQKN